MPGTSSRASPVSSEKKRNKVRFREHACRSAAVCVRGTCIRLVLLREILWHKTNEGFCILGICWKRPEVIHDKLGKEKKRKKNTNVDAPGNWFYDKKIVFTEKFKMDAAHAHARDTHFPPCLQTSSSRCSRASPLASLCWRPPHPFGSSVFLTSHFLTLFSSGLPHQH